MATPAEVSAARADAYAQQTSRLREITRTTLLSYFLAGQFRDVDVTRFLARAIPLVLSSRRRMASLTAAYIDRALRDAGNAPGRPVAVPDTDRLRGVDAPEVYQRPFRQVWTDLSQDKDFPAAVKAAETRLTQLIETDLQLAKTQAAQAVMAESTGSGFYQRVPKGEHDCVMCILTSTRVYTKSELLPIHPGCDCDVEPIPLADLPAFKADALTRLQDAHALVEETLGITSDPSGRNAGLAKRDGFADFLDLIVTREHGEYGPTLTIRGQNFTGPSEVAQATP